MQNEGNRLYFFMHKKSPAARYLVSKRYFRHYGFLILIASRIKRVEN
jgi:hypothetical protein